LYDKYSDDLLLNIPVIYDLAVLLNKLNEKNIDFIFMLDLTEPFKKQKQICIQNNIGDRADEWIVFFNSFLQAMNKTTKENVCKCEGCTSAMRKIDEITKIIEK
jgi:hypothetical protein